MSAREGRSPEYVADHRARWLVEVGPLAWFTTFLWLKLVHVALSLRDVWWAPAETWSSWVAQHPGLFTAVLANLLVIGAPVALLPRRARFFTLLVLNLLITTLAVGDRVHAHFYGNLLVVTRIRHVAQLRWVTASVLEEVRWIDAVYYLDVLLVMALVPWYLRAERGVPRFGFAARVSSFAVLLGAGSIVAVPTISRLARDANGSSVFVNLERDTCASVGVLSCHAADVFRRVTRRYVSPGEELALARNFQEERRKSRRPSELSGVAAGRNVIMILAESLQGFPIGLEVKGQPVCPHLSALARESLNFVNFYDQTHLGTTADGEFTSLQSLHPLPDAVVAWEYPRNQYHGLPAILADHGYSTFSTCAVDAGFWNRSVMHPRLGFQRSLFEDGYRVSERLPLWLGDREFLEQAVPRLQAQPEPFFSFLLTSTSHHPFVLPEKYRELDLGTLEGSYLGNYLQSVHYLDAAMGGFLERLEKTGLLDRSVIVLYGDHQAFLDYPPELARLLGLPEESLYASFKTRKRLPLLIRLPGGAHAGDQASAGGHLDVAPTILSLLGVPEGPGPMMGRDLTSGSSMVVFRDASFADGEHYFINRVGPITSASCYESKTGLPADCTRLEARFEEAKEELEVSDSIIRGDLIPALRESGGQVRSR